MAATASRASKSQSERVPRDPVRQSASGWSSPAQARPGAQRHLRPQLRAVSAPYAHLKRCEDLGRQDLAEAAGSRDACLALLSRWSQIAAPGQGAPIVMLLFARLASELPAWLDGPLRVEIAGDERSTTMEVCIELGGGLCERALPRVELAVPLAEFVGVVARFPAMLAPLYAQRALRRLILSTLEGFAGEAIGIDEECMRGPATEG